MPKGALKIEYKPEVDILTIYLQQPEKPLSYSSEVETGVILHLENGIIRERRLWNIELG